MRRKADASGLPESFQLDSINQRNASCSISSAKPLLKSRDNLLHAFRLHGVPYAINAIHNGYGADQSTLHLGLRLRKRKALLRPNPWTSAHYFYLAMTRGTKIPTRLLPVLHSTLLSLPLDQWLFPQFRTTFPWSRLISV